MEATNMPLTGPIPEGHAFFCPNCGALYAVTHSRLSKSESNMSAEKLWTNGIQPRFVSSNWFIGLKCLTIRPPYREESHGMVQPENINSGCSNSQLGDRSGCNPYCNLTHLPALSGSSFIPAACSAGSSRHRTSHDGAGPAECSPRLIG